MSPSPRPLPWRTLSVSRRDDKHRWEGCSHYQQCLDQASGNFWNSFTCFFCPLNPLGKDWKGEKGLIPRKQNHHMKGRRND